MLASSVLLVDEVFWEIERQNLQTGASDEPPGFRRSKR